MKKINKRLFVILPIVLLSFALVVAVGIYFATINVTAHVDEAFSTTTIDLDVSGLPGETIVKTFDVQNDANVPLNVELIWLEKSNSYVLDNMAGTCLPYPSSTCEKRIVIQASDIGVETLDDLQTIEWDSNVISGYLPHVDVFLDNGEVLVFEYAKVQPVCDNAPYPTGKLNTFGNKGIVDDSAKAWLSSGPAGPCGDPSFDANYKTLTDWKVFYPNANVLRFEFEVDNWISPSSSEVSNILVNGDETTAQGVIYTNDLSKVVTMQPGANTVSVEFVYNPATPVGKFAGAVTLTRVE